MHRFKQYRVFNYLFVVKMNATKTKNNPKSSSSQPVQKINNNQQAISSAPSTPKTHASPSTKTENNPKSSSVTSSPINNAKKPKNSGLFTQKKVDSPQSNSFIETKHYEVQFSPEEHESPLPQKIKPIISNLSPNTKDTSVKKHDSPPKDKKETNADLLCQIENIKNENSFLPHQISKIRMHSGKVENENQLLKAQNIEKDQKYEEIKEKNHILKKQAEIMTKLLSNENNIIQNTQEKFITIEELNEMTHIKFLSQSEIIDTSVVQF